MRLRGSRAGGLALVLLLHGLAVWLGWRALLGPTPDPARSWITLRLVPPERPEPPRAVERAVAPRLAPLALPPVMPLQPSVQAESATGLAAPSQQAATGAAPSAAGTASAPLDLRPSKAALRGALVNPATQDPRANTPRPSAEERMAMAIDPELCVREERLPDGSVRRWMGRLSRTTSAIETRTGHKGLPVAVCE